VSSEDASGTVVGAVSVWARASWGTTNGEGGGEELDEPGSSGEERDSTSENGWASTRDESPLVMGADDGMSPAPLPEVATTVPAALMSTP